LSAAVEVADLVKRYPKRETNAVDGLTFAVQPGEVFGLLGPNGAGKTTTVGVLTTMIAATSGEASVDGIDVHTDPVTARSRLAVVPQRSNLDRSLTPRQNLAFHAAYHGVGRAERKARAAEMLEQFGLGDQADVKVDWYSGGMAQRLMIARALMHQPKVLFLDEPTTGLDPQARLFVWDRIRALRDAGVTVVLTTHDMDEAAELCDRVGIVDHGRLLALDTPTALTRELTGRTVLDLTIAPNVQDGNGGGPAGDTDWLGALTAVPGVERGERLPSMPGAADIRVRLALAGEPASVLGPAVSGVAGHGGTLTDIHVGEPSLEDVFIELTGRTLR
jgi:ABC-2 type transport system ATP-binding protein